MLYLVLKLLSLPPHPHPQPHTQLKPFVSTKAFIIYWYPVLRWDYNALLSFVAGSYFFLREYHICYVQMCWYSVSTPQRLSKKDEEQDSSLAKERLSIYQVPVCAKKNSE